MCNYVNGNTCRITNQQCPYMFYCNQTGGYKPMNSMPDNCKVITTQLPPDGFYKVVQARKQWLYVRIGTQTIMIENPFNEVPAFVKLDSNHNIIERK